MVWVTVTKQGREFISMCKPIRVKLKVGNEVIFKIKEI